MSWRQHSDPPAELKRLGVTEQVERLGWGKEKIATELERADTEEAFLGRLRTALKKAQEELDPVRLLPKSLGQDYTKHPHLSAEHGREPEAVDEDTQKRLSREALVENSAKQLKGRAREETIRLEFSLARARRRGRRATVHTLERQLDAVRREMDDEAA